jgi:predicted small metal-binding protein
VDTVLVCDCGFEARAGDEDRLAVEIRRHAREAHGMDLSFDEALLLAIRAGERPAGSERPKEGR